MSSSDEEPISKNSKVLLESDSSDDEDNAKDNSDENDAAHGSAKAEKNRVILESDSSDDEDNAKDTVTNDDEVSNQPVEKKKKEKKKKKDSADSKNDDDDHESDSEDNDDTKEDRDDEKDDKAGDDDDDEDDDDDDVIDSDDGDRGQREPAPIYDFDIMMAKKKEENSRKRKRRNYDIINDNDDIIADIINQMRDAVEADIEANKNRMAATKKLKLLPFVISQLRKVDLRDAFLDSEVLSVITEWLAPLPDRSLPHLHIRESLLKILIDFNLYDVDRIKSSGIGKAIMYLSKHPKETKENKQKAKQLISSWSRPIFNLESSFGAISREEREERDLELMKKQRRISGQESSDNEGAGTSSQGKKSKADTEPVALKPGEKGWIPRARVPAPSTKDYVIRPRSKVDGDVGKGSKRPANMLEKLMRTQQERRRANKQQRAVNMKIDRG